MCRMSRSLLSSLTYQGNDPGHCLINGVRYALPYGLPCVDYGSNGTFQLVFGEEAVVHSGMCTCHPGCDSEITSIKRLPRLASSIQEAMEKGYIVSA